MASRYVTARIALAMWALGVLAGFIGAHTVAALQTRAMVAALVIEVSPARDTWADVHSVEDACEGATWEHTDGHIECLGWER